MTYYKKGSVCSLLGTAKIFPLFVVTKEEQQLWTGLPNFLPHQESYLSLVKPGQDSTWKHEILQRIKKEITSEDFTLVNYISAGVCLIGTDFLDYIDTATLSDDDEHVDANLKSFISRIHSKYIQEYINLQDWNNVVLYITQHLFIVWKEHPLVSYASNIVPRLTSDERMLVEKSLSLESMKPLGMIKKIQDSYPSQPYGVLLTKDAACPPHSCLPTAHLEVNVESNSASIVALYDCDALTIQYIQDDESFEVRNRRIDMRTGESCGCLRCRYEIDPTTYDLSVGEAMQLAQLYMASNQLNTARELYQQLVRDGHSNADAWHALGAIALSMKQFVEAQRIWNKALAQNNMLCKTHPGLSLQRDKCEAYGYLSPRNDPEKASSIPFAPIIDKVSFVSQLLQPELCQQIIQWAHQGEWTKQRHYAVPTHDVPIHTVQPLLNWFNEWFHQDMRPLLARQFKTSANFFVHDAFCVRYQAGKASNHLPIHTDESTHSFVVALNEDYEGGGTYFYESDKIVHLKTGQVLSFAGETLEHGGEMVSKGERYIIAAFLYHDDTSDIIPPVSSINKRQWDAWQILLESRKSLKSEGFSFNFCTPND